MPRRAPARRPGRRRAASGSSRLRSSACHSSSASSRSRSVQLGPQLGEALGAGRGVDRRAHPVGGDQRLFAQPRGQRAGRDDGGEDNRRHLGVGRAGRRAGRPRPGPARRPGPAARPGRAARRRWPRAGPRSRPAAPGGLPRRRSSAFVRSTCSRRRASSVVRVVDAAEHGVFRRSPSRRSSR